MINLLSKIGLSGGVISGAYFINILPNEINFETIQKAKITEKMKKNTTNINSIEDIELFERIHGCLFVYSNDQSTNTLYTARGFEEQEEDIEWKHKSFEGGHRTEAQKLCQTHGGIITLFRDGGDFRLGRPYGGW